MVVDHTVMHTPLLLYTKYKRTRKPYVFFFDAHMSLRCTPSTRVLHTHVLLLLQVMSVEEIAWVNTYHKEVREALTPRLADDAETLQWLQEATKPIAA